MINNNNIQSRQCFNTWLRAFLSIIFIIVSSAGCEDPLPVYVEPKNIFAATFVRADSTLIQYYETDEKDVTPEGPMISYNQYTPNFQFICAVENTYEETMEGTASIEGKLEVWNSLHPEMKATIPVTLGQIITGPTYNASTNTIVMNPGDKTFFSVKWNYRFDSGMWLHQTMGVSGQQILTGRSWYVIHSPGILSARLTISLFKNATAAITETKIPTAVRGVIHVTKP